MSNILNGIQKVSLNETVKIVKPRITESTKPVVKLNPLEQFQQLLEGISQEELADVLCHRLEMRYPDIYSKYDYDTVYRAVDDVASFHAGAEELGSSDIGIMLRSVIKRLEEQQGVEEGLVLAEPDTAGLGDSNTQEAIISTVEKLFRKNEINDYGALEAIRQGVKHHFSKPGATAESAIEGILNILDKRMRKSGNYVDLGRFKEALRQGVAHQLKKQGVAEGYKEPTDAAGHAKMAAKIKRMLDDALADRGDRHGNPDPERLTRAYEYHMKKAEEKSQGVAEGLSSDKNMSALQKVVDAAAKYGFKMSNRSKNGQKIILHNTDFHQWMTCRIRNINGKIYIDYDESSNINGLRNEVVTPSEFIQRLKNYYLKGQAWLEKIRKRDAAEKNFVGIRVEQYPYGKPSSGLKAAVKFLNRNGKRGHEYFDFPEYADIPDEISSELMPEEVDFIQDHWDEVPAGKQGVAEGFAGYQAVRKTRVGNTKRRAREPGFTGEPGKYNKEGILLGKDGHPVIKTNAYREYIRQQKDVAEEQLNELSTEKLAQYKKAAGEDARKADKEGDYDRGNKRFSGIVKATKKQFDNETKPKKESTIMKGIVDETLGTPYPGTYEQENKPFQRKGPQRTMKIAFEGK